MVNPILVDTNAYAAIKRGNPDAVFIVRRAPFLAVNTIILGELLGGFAHGTKADQNRRELELFLRSPRLTCHAVDRDTAEHYAKLYTAMRANGTPIPTNDLWIAASAIQHASSLFSFDAHFRNVPGLRVGTTFDELSGP